LMCILLLLKEQTLNALTAEQYNIIGNVLTTFLKAQWEKSYFD